MDLPAKPVPRLMLALGGSLRIALVAVGYPTPVGAAGLALPDRRRLPP